MHYVNEHDSMQNKNHPQEQNKPTLTMALPSPFHHSPCCWDGGPVQRLLWSSAEWGVEPCGAAWGERRHCSK